MTLNITTIRSLAGAAVLATVMMPGDARAQFTTPPTQGNLNLRESSGPPRGYAFLLPAPVNGTPEITVQFKPVDKTLEPDQWTWQMFTGENVLWDALKARWYAQASCPDDLTKLQVIGPAGTLTQNPLWNPIYGYFETQSFTNETIKDACITWFNDHTCDTTVPGCEKVKIFNLTGGVAPAGSADRLRLKASCTSGPVADAYYASSLKLTCLRDTNY
jgi:hypothetical protein